MKPRMTAQAKAMATVVMCALALIGAGCSVLANSLDMPDATLLSVSWLLMGLAGFVGLLTLGLHLWQPESLTNR